MVLDQQHGLAKDALAQGRDAALGNYGEAKSLYQPVAANYGAYSDMYKNALGLGGTEGSQGAINAFRGANPGYGFQFDQGMQGLNRAASAGGRLASGNAMMEAQKYGTGLADQSYQNWLSNLFRGGQQAYQGIQGQSQALDAMGRTNMGYGQSLAQLETDMGDKTASMGMSGFKAGDTAAANRFGAVMGGLGLVSNLAGSLFGGGGSIFKGFGK